MVQKGKNAKEKNIKEADVLFVSKPTSSSARQRPGDYVQLGVPGDLHISKANKELFDYKQEKPFARLTKILGGKKVIQKSIQSQMDLVILGDKGVTKDALLHLAKYLSCSMNQIAQLLPVTERTIQRYTSKKHFNRVVSEQILQIAEVAAKGSEVFESRDKFLTWMDHPNVALGKKTPMSLLNSKFGVNMVLDELGRIEHGVFS